MSFPELVDYAGSLDCIHCGLCLQTCPTFRLTGSEAASPRGRIHLMRAVGEGRIEADADFAAEMDACLLCRHCESVCPAGVRFGEMMAHTRNGLEQRKDTRGRLARVVRFLAFRRLLPSRLALRMAGSFLRLTQLLRLDRLAAMLLGKWGASAPDTPRVPPLSARRLLPARIAAVGEESEEFLFLEGCVMPELFPHVNRATVMSLAATGAAVRILPETVCCGSLHAHNGDESGARELAMKMIADWETAGQLPLITNSAGCGAHMKECRLLFEEADPWRARAERFGAAVLDYTEAIAARLPDDLHAPQLVGTVAWDDPCHLCHGQGVRAEPRAVLDAIQGLERVELPDSEGCCGSAGIYSVLHPEDAREIFSRKLQALEKCGAQTLVTANPGCHMQWAAGLKRAGSSTRVVHLAEIVAAGKRG